MSGTCVTLKHMNILHGRAQLDEVIGIFRKGGTQDPVEELKKVHQNGLNSDYVEKFERARGRLYQPIQPSIS